MNTHLLVLVRLVLAWLAPCAAIAADANSITWYKFDLPPVYVLSGAHAGTGVHDVVVRILTREMPGYQHKTDISNLKRIEETLRRQDQVLVAGMLKTPEREGYMLFSEPYINGPLLAVIVDKSRGAEFQNYLDADGNISLEDLLSKSNFQLGIASGRAYSSNIDQLLRSNPGRKNVYARYGSNISQGLLTMLWSRHIDYTIFYPSEAQYLLQVAGEQRQLTSFPIKGLPPYLPIYVAAPNNAWGRQMLDVVNPILKKYRGKDEINKAAERWLAEAATQRYRKYSSFNTP